VQIRSDREGVAARVAIVGDEADDLDRGNVLRVEFDGGHGRRGGGVDAEVREKRAMEALKIAGFAEKNVSQGRDLVLPRLLGERLTVDGDGPRAAGAAPRDAKCVARGRIPFSARRRGDVVLVIVGFVGSIGREQAPPPGAIRSSINRV